MLYMTEYNPDAGTEDSNDNSKEEGKPDGQKENREDKTNKEYEQQLWENYLNAVATSKGKGKRSWHRGNGLQASRGRESPECEG